MTDISSTRELPGIKDSIRLTYLGYAPAEAYRLADEAIGRADADSELCAMASHMLLWRGRRDEAQNALKRARALEPDSPFVVAAEADLAAFDGSAEGALALVERALSSGCIDPWLFRVCSGAQYCAHAPESALATVVRWVEVSPDCDAAVALQFDLLWTTGRAEDAEALLSDAAKRFADSPLVWHRRARLLLRKGNRSDALVLCRQAAEATAGDFEIQADLAMMLAYSGSFDEAESVALAAIEISSCAIPALGAMAHVCRERGRDKEAAEWTRRAKMAIPAFYADMVLSEDNAAIRANNFEKALSLTNAALPNLMPSTRQTALYIKGLSLRFLQRYDELDAVTHEIGYPGKRPASYYELRSDLLQARGEHAEFLELVEEGLAAYPELVPLRAGRVVSLHALGRLGEASEAASDVVRLPLASPTEYSQAFQALDACGFACESREILSQGLERFPDDNALKLAAAVGRFEVGDFGNAVRMASEVNGQLRDVAESIPRSVSHIERLRALAGKLLGKKHGGPPPVAN